MFLNKILYEPIVVEKFIFLMRG